MFSWAELFLPWSSLDTVGLSEISVLGMWLLCPHQHMVPYLWQRYSPYSPRKGEALNPNLQVTVCHPVSLLPSLFFFSFLNPLPEEFPTGLKKVMSTALGTWTVRVIASSLTRKSGEQEPYPISLGVPAGAWTGMVSGPGIVGVGMDFSVIPN